MTRMLIIGLSVLLTMSTGLMGCATSSVVNSTGVSSTQENDEGNEKIGTRRFASDGPAERFTGYSGGGGSARIK